MTEVKREIATRDRPDGIFINRWDGSGPCFCAPGRKNFRDASGFELPRSSSPQDPARRAYILWQQDRLFALGRRWDDAVRAISPDSCVMPNAGGGAASSPDTKRIGELAPTLMADHQARRGVTASWATANAARSFARRWGGSRSWASSASGWRSRIGGRTRCKLPRRSADGRSPASRTGGPRSSGNLPAASTIRAGGSPWRNSTRGARRTSGICGTSGRSRG